MVKRNISELAVYEVKEETETVLFTDIYKLYLEKTSEIIYVNKGRKLYGIISMGETLNQDKDGRIMINKRFTFLSEYNVTKAHEIFRDKRWIHKIPVTNRNGELIGDYSRWDDIMFIERSSSLLMRKESVQKILKQYKAVYVIKPIEYKHPFYLAMIKYLESFQIEFEILNKELLVEKISDEGVYIFFHEDERRGCKCLYGMKSCFGHDSEKVKDRQIITYKDLLIQIMKKEQLDRLEIRKGETIPYDRVDQKATLIFTALQEKGIKCLCLYSNEIKPTEYGQKIREEIEERLKCYPLETEKPWPKKNENEEFYGELYQFEDYESGAAQKEIRQAITSFEYKKDMQGRYFNAKDGRRVTCFQPEEFVGTIYFLGPCTMIGGFVEDQHTIESYLQKELIERGYRYRVENYGGMLRSDSELDSRLEEIDSFGKNDIVIYLLRSGEVAGIENKSLEKMFEKNQISSKWIADRDLYFHCNYKANEMLAHEIFYLLEPHMADKSKGGEIQFDVCNIMGSYVKKKYLDQYFENFTENKYSSIGAIVMNCNPFSKGHRYLIEQAHQKVECLIIFVVEEDESIFPFEERFKLVKEGTRDLDHVMVVPSGEFILSKNNFRQYFSKLDDGAIVCNAEYDINVFADYIAKPLGINYRFAGDEPEDRVTRIYNEAMEKILPLKGIEFVKFQRAVLDDEIISASKVRKYLNEMDYAKAYSMVPDGVKQYFDQQTN